jgi:hypothetical protein
MTELAAELTFGNESEIIYYFIIKFVYFLQFPIIELDNISIYIRGINLKPILTNIQGLINVILTD